MKRISTLALPLSSRAFAALLVGALAVPATMTGLFRSVDDEGVKIEQSTDLHEAAWNDAARIRANRRGYWLAVEMYNELTRLGYKDLVFPDINDTESIAYYLDKKNFLKEDADATHAAAPEATVEPTAPEASPAPDPFVEYDALPEIYQDLLDGYVDTGRCPPSLRQFHQKGFYDLCTRLLDARINALRSNLAERSANLRGLGSAGLFPVWTMKERLLQLENSLLYEGGTSVRPRTYEGSRPRIQYPTE